MFSTLPTLTVAGKGLLIRALAGEQLTFTRMAIGSGSLATGQDQDDLTELINEELSIALETVDTSQTGYIAISGSFGSDEITDEFAWREIGLFAQGEDETELLYAYANDGDAAEMLGALDPGVYTDQTLTFNIEIGEAENVTFNVGAGAYVTRTQFDTALGAKVDKSSVVNNLTTETEGHVLDARQGKAIGEALNTKAKYAKWIEIAVETTDWNVISNGYCYYDTAITGMSGYLSVIDAVVMDNVWEDIPAGEIKWTSHNGRIYLETHIIPAHEIYLYLLVQEVTEGRAANTVPFGTIQDGPRKRCYATGITASSTDTLMDLHLLEPDATLYKITMVANVASGDVCSVYIVRYPDTVDGFTLLSTLYEGTAAAAPRLSSTGVLTLNSDTSQRQVNMIIEIIG